MLIDGGYLKRDPIITHKAGSGKVEGWTADILSDRALEFIRTAGDAPWFMTVAHIIPHLPWVCEERFSVPFRDQGLSPELAVCYGSIAQLDEAVGRLLAGLKQAGQDSRTIVVFVSDNGMTDKDSASKPFSPEDCKRRNIHHLRGPRFKFHSLPGGATGLFDLAADPGETADVSATFPDTARKLARECRQRWDAVLASGRAFGMPILLVGDPSTAGRRAGASIVPGSAAQALAGRVRVVQQTAQGFAHPGDGIQYALDVQRPAAIR